MATENFNKQLIVCQGLWFIKWKLKQQQQQQHFEVNF